MDYPRLPTFPHDVVCHVFYALAAVAPPQSIPKGHSWPTPWRGATSPGSLGWIKLTHVSRDWRRIGLDISALWADIICVFPQAFDTMLDRAKNMPLTLNLDHGETLDHIWNSTKILDILPRVRCLQDTRGWSVKHRRLRSTLSEDWISVLEGRALTSLESLTLWHYNEPAETTHIYNKPFAAPALTALTIDFLFPFQAPSLKTLAVTEHISHWRQLLDIVASCPQLEILRVGSLEEPTFDEWEHKDGGLTRYFFRDDQHFGDTPVPVAHLPRLRLFEVTRRWGSDSDKFLSQLEVPAACAIKKGHMVSPNEAEGVWLW
ncbi:hypothetical protein PENSPDRAFT_757429 [Peniophora sp. CONT]|nr:hypothetical protein PENSPDRAFT_757429 [Peniophora sp. CONT]